MLSPKRTKFRKAHKGRIHGMAKGGTSLNFGAYGLKATSPERITARQIEAAPVGQSHAICVVLVGSGSGCFQMCLYHQSLLKLEWVKVKAHQNIGLPELPLDGSCLSWMGFHGN